METLNLLNYDYKIFAKLIANRLDMVIHTIIGTQQTGFIKNQYIGNNLMKTFEIVSDLCKTNTPGIIATVDFEKCFDRVEYKSIDGAFDYFGFGTYLRSLVQVLFGKFKISTQNNGYLSPPTR